MTNATSGGCGAGTEAAQHHAVTAASDLSAIADFAALGLPLRADDVRAIRRAAEVVRRLAGEVDGLRATAEADRLIEAYAEEFGG